MPGPTPQPNRQARPGRDLPWTDLPSSGPVGPTPKPPTGAGLKAEGKRLWADYWSTPSATQWGIAEVHQVKRLCQLADRLTQKDDTRVLGEMRHLETALGLTAKSRKELRWRIVDGDTVLEQNGKDTPAGDARARLRVVG